MMDNSTWTVTRWSAESAEISFAAATYDLAGGSLTIFDRRSNSYSIEPWSSHKDALSELWRVFNSRMTSFLMGEREALDIACNPESLRKLLVSLPSAGPVKPWTPPPGIHPNSHAFSSPHGAPLAFGPRSSASQLDIFFNARTCRLEGLATSEPHGHDNFAITYRYAPASGFKPFQLPSDAKRLDHRPPIKQT